MIVVTGATGHIGNNFAHLLSTRGLEYKLLTRSISPAIEEYLEHCVVGDIFDNGFLEQEVHEGDVFVHFAAFLDLYDNNLDEAMYTNDFGARVIFDFCSTHHIRLLFSSSVDIIARTRTETHIKEPEEIRLDLLESNYALTKASATKYLLELIDSGKIDATIIYPSAVIGPRDFKPSKAGEEIYKSLNRRLFLYVDGGYNFIDVEDVALYALEIIERGIRGSFILGAHNIKVHDFFRLINQINGTKGIYLKAPKWISMLYARISKEYSVMMMQAIFDNYRYDLTRMNSAFLHRPKPFEHTVRDTIAWFKSNPIKK